MGSGPLVKVAQVLKWRALSEASRVGGPGQRTGPLRGCGGVSKDPKKGLAASLSILKGAASSGESSVQGLGALPPASGPSRKMEHVGGRAARMAL